MTNKKQMPKEIYIYAAEWVDGVPVFAVASDLSGIDFFDDDGVEKEVGVYKLDHTGTVRLRKEFTPHD